MTCSRHGFVHKALAIWVGENGNVNRRPVFGKVDNTRVQH
jgi:hypothetical protein